MQTNSGAKTSANRRKIDVSDIVCVVMKYRLTFSAIGLYVDVLP
ncbi:MAG: hypothetical protein AAFX52_02525 [Pseudomonadota bacterium]